MAKYPGVLTFIPVPVPLMPEPYRTGNAVDIWKYTHDPANAQGDPEEFQQILNNEAVIAGNLLAKTAVREYNSQVIRYWQNGGPNNTSGNTLPNPLPDQSGCYKPAPNATKKDVNGTWVPSGPPTKIKPWTLPPGTVLVK